ncbi:MAG: DUF58 domain-containing protein [Microthrixaceae bacterium]
MRETMWRSVLLRLLAVGLATSATVYATGLLAGDRTVAALPMAALIAVVSIGTVWPILSIGRLRLEVTDSPHDLVVGTPLRVALRARGAALSGPFWVVDLDGTVPARGIPTGFEVRLGGLPRGVHETIELFVLSRGPFGIVRLRRHVTAVLPHPVWVAPLLGAPHAADGTDGDDPGHHDGCRPHAHGEIRSLRPYRPADPPHLVHWPTTARLGELMVREFDAPSRPVLDIRLDLPEDRELADAEAEARGNLALGTLRTGRPVRVSAWRAGRPVVSVPRDERTLRRVLAAAEPAPLAPVRDASRHDPTVRTPTDDAS